jgi:hypothetical protein
MNKPPNRMVGIVSKGATAVAASICFTLDEMKYP